jgi:hypothetical protein
VSICALRLNNQPLQMQLTIDTVSFGQVGLLGRRSADGRYVSSDGGGAD